MSDPYADLDRATAAWERSRQCRCPLCRGETELTGASETLDEGRPYSFEYDCENCPTSFTVHASQDLEPVGLVEVTTAVDGYMETRKLPWYDVRKTRISGRYRPEPVDGVPSC